MSRNHHYIKINPRYFIPIEHGEKTFEVRYNDRSYKVNDILHLREYADGEYTGRQIDAEVTYLLDDNNFCKEGYVVMSLNVFNVIK